MTSTEDVVVVAGEPVAPVAAVAAVKPGRARPVAVARASVGQAEANKAVAASDAAGYRAAQNPELAADQVSWDWETRVENAPLDVGGVAAFEGDGARMERNARLARTACCCFCPCGED